MDVEALRSSPVGRLEPISGVDPSTGRDWQYWAFVPTPLPSEPPLNLSAIHAATEAGMEVARLDQAATQLPNAEILVRPIVRREAVSTSALEGTYATFDEVLEADFIDESRQSAEQREVHNYVRATEQAMDLLHKYPISRRMLGTLQHTIVRGTPGETYDAGDIRRRQVCIGPKHRPIEESRFVPPPPGPGLEELFSDWEKWVNAQDNIPAVIKAALAHYQFETMHPYADGNGRLGRLIALLQLIQSNVLRLPILSIAPWLEENRDEYQDGLLRVTKSGDFNDWITFFSRAISIQARAGVRKIALLIQFRDEMLAKLRSSGYKGAAIQIAENLIGFPVIDVQTATKLTGKTFETTNQAVAKLVSMGYLQEITGRPKNRLFACPTVIFIINS
ncbi:Fic family protein [Yinghuangia seranimata]|uniref:Fic family protein n=1 Tax=Yinghuangia seranimata TaxID=408067 RepID=UPI00248B7ED1|nr:Fic/DOC family N-terminal domain-containing protein [Yinghuangia seranimata]MDI2126936.1 Fic/DOC family N-terminal domain-containing protein [Yinghuangia seranimata]